MKLFDFLFIISAAVVLPLISLLGMKRMRFFYFRVVHLG